MAESLNKLKKQKESSLKKKQQAWKGLRSLNLKQIVREFASVNDSQRLCLQNQYLQGGDLIPSDGAFIYKKERLLVGQRMKEVSVRYSKRIAKNAQLLKTRRNFATCLDSKMLRTIANHSSYGETAPILRFLAALYDDLPGLRPKQCKRLITEALSIAKSLADMESNSNVTVDLDVRSCLILFYCIERIFFLPISKHILMHKDLKVKTIGLDHITTSMVYESKATDDQLKRGLVVEPILRVVEEKMQCNEEKAQLQEYCEMLREAKLLAHDESDKQDDEIEDPNKREERKEAREQLKVEEIKSLIRHSLVVHRDVNSKLNFNEREIRESLEKRRRAQMAPNRNQTRGKRVPK